MVNRRFALSEAKGDWTGGPLGKWRNRLEGWRSTTVRRCFWAPPSG